MHVPIVQSDSFRRNLGERLTEQICKQIELKTPYKLADADAADSILTARIVSESKRVLAENGLDEARDVETDFFVQVRWVDRRGDLIMSHTDIPIQPLLVNVSQATNFVAEGGQSLATSHQEAMFRLADQIVGQLELPW
ncbi:hypothetical protein ETAA8_02980 [Anatilimnocola aggregata]|uniref:Uncharacterized protein n=1 Tax=Anatilimnocola aggregata TaxID=2528021 RepID=A0A517Y4T0_9BACT|nr:hypothetical protein ETAA8_02980 [Anatilimnocola aggregata]